MKILSKVPKTKADILRRRIALALDDALIAGRTERGGTSYTLNTHVAADLDGLVEKIARVIEFKVGIPGDYVNFMGPKEPCIPV